jgi:hypothetical protein
LSIKGNVIAHDASSQPYGTAIGLSAYNEGLQNVTVDGNTVYDWRGGLNIVYQNGTLSNVTIKNNSLSESSGRVVTLDASVRSSQFTFSANTYNGPLNVKWFVQAGENDYSLEQWKLIAPELNALQLTDAYPDPERSLATYNQSLGGSATLDAFLVKARQQSRLTWDANFTAVSAGNYIRAGFGLGSIAP